MGLQAKKVWRFFVLEELFLPYYNLITIVLKIANNAGDSKGGVEVSNNNNFT